VSVTDYDAIVYDLDGTLVRLPVDWAAVRETCATVFRVRDIDVADASLWEMLDIAAEHDLSRDVERRISESEREAARSATRLPLADDVPGDTPTGVCSLNAEAACRIALELHGLDGHVDAIVGRDSVENPKPHPEPLLRTVDLLGVDPGATLFIGDSDTDAEAARRAGVDFQRVEERRADRPDGADA
jgi:phosphoglycolate phosphatase